MKILKELLSYVIIIIIVILIRTFIMTPVRVDGHSMDPTLQNNEILLLKKYDKNIERFDVIVINYDDSNLVKRVVGLPGEHIRYENNVLYVNDTVVSENFKTNGRTYDFDLNELDVDIIPDNYYFVMGDNRTNSTDSRIIGLVNIKDIKGTTSYALFPFNKFGKIK